MPGPWRRLSAEMGHRTRSGILLQTGVIVKLLIEWRRSLAGGNLLFPPPNPPTRGGIFYPNLLKVQLKHDTMVHGVLTLRPRGKVLYGKREKFHTFGLTGAAKANNLP